MKFTNLFVSALAGCLLVVGTSARTAQAGPDPATTMPKFVAQTLKAAGIKVKRNGDELTVEKLVVLEVPSSLQDWEDFGMQVLSSVPLESDAIQLLQADFPPPSEDDLGRFVQFKNCISAANFVSQLGYAQCKLGPTNLKTLVCETGVLLNEVFADLQCIFTYICTPENNFCE